MGREAGGISLETTHYSAHMGVFADDMAHTPALGWGGGHAGSVKRTAMLSEGKRSPNPMAIELTICSPSALQLLTASSSSSRCWYEGRIEGELEPAARGRRGGGAPGPMRHRAARAGGGKR